MANDADSAPSPDLQFKTCTKCGETKLLSDFYRNKACRLGVDNRCKFCAIAASVAYQKANPEKTRAKNVRWNADNQDRASENKRRWNEANLEKRAELGAAWSAANPERVRQIKSRWKADNREAVRAYEIERRSTPKLRLEDAVRAGVTRSISRGSKYGRKTFDLLGYSSAELRANIESKFLPGMTWENYAHDTWHIDHIIPLAAFNYETPDCPDFKRAWALTNLQPLWAFDNMSKGARLDHPSQAAILAAT